MDTEINEAESTLFDNLMDIWLASESHLESIGIKPTTENVAWVFSGVFYCLIPFLGESSAELLRPSFGALCRLHGDKTGHPVSTSYAIKYLFPKCWELIDDLISRELDPFANEENLRIVYRIIRAYMSEGSNPPNISFDDHTDFLCDFAVLLERITPKADAVCKNEVDPEPSPPPAPELSEICLSDDSAPNPTYGDLHITSEAVRYIPNRTPTATAKQRPTSKAQFVPSKQAQKQDRIKELEHTIHALYEKLDEEKGKRQWFLFIAYFVFSFFGLCSFGILDVNGGFFLALFLSAIFGAILAFVPILLFEAVTSSFTRIDDLKDGIRSLEKELYRLKSRKGSDDI